MAFIDVSLNLGQLINGAIQAGVNAGVILLVVFTAFSTGELVLTQSRSGIIGLTATLILMLILPMISVVKL